uniref:Uncharacterized protein n=1 Tax=Oryza punctata TaxID=4537 RepID=A0A0E0K0F6_ORYPU
MSGLPLSASGQEATPGHPVGVGSWRSLDRVASGLAVAPWIDRRQSLCRSLLSVSGHFVILEVSPSMR